MVVVVLLFAVVVAFDSIPLSVEPLPVLISIPVPVITVARYRTRRYAYRQSRRNRYRLEMDDGEVFQYPNVDFHHNVNTLAKTRTNSHRNVPGPI